MTRFEELKAKHEKKQITIDEALELLGLYKVENDKLSSIVTLYREGFMGKTKINIKGLPLPIVQPRDAVFAGIGYLAAKMLE